MELTFATVALAGLLSFLSPCVLPLVPPYLCYLAGSSLDDLTEQAPLSLERRRLIIGALCFIAGFSTVFIALGASASLLGQVILKNTMLFSQIAGILILILGLHFLGVFRLGFLFAEKRFNFPSAVNPLGAYTMGLAFAFGWTPCIGPVLAAILAKAAK